jgi:phospholipase C
MSTPQTAQVCVTNVTDGVATIMLWHENSDYPVDSVTWTNVGPGQTTGPLTVHSNTGGGSLTVQDYWASEIDVVGGSTPGVFESSGVLEYSKWKKCQLQSAGAGKTLTFTVSSKSLDINMPSGGTTTPMNPVSRSSADVYVINTTDGNATITLYHSNNTDGLQSSTWPAAPGKKVGPLTVYFRVGMSVALQPDYWGVKLAVQDGSAPGIYTSVGDWALFTDWNECQLEAADASKDILFTVSTTTFNIALPSGGTQPGMQKTGPYTLVDNVFVLMLENHSFDNIFAFSKIKGLTVPTSADKNSYNGVSYAVGSSAPSAMPTDPGHEFVDVVEQLCGQGATHTPWQPYNQPISNSGFAANYATTRTEITSNNPNLPTPAQFGEIMQCFDTQKDLPVLSQLATTFAVCDHWFSSIPGPTWPNRFFVHGASSGGWADTPGVTNIGGWETPGFGFTYPSGSSIFDKLDGAGLQRAVYIDPTGPIGGNIP